MRAGQCVAGKLALKRQPFAGGAVGLAEQYHAFRPASDDGGHTGKRDTASDAAILGAKRAVRAGDLPAQRHDGGWDGDRGVSGEDSVERPANRDKLKLVPTWKPARQSVYN